MLSLVLIYLQARVVGKGLTTTDGSRTPSLANIRGKSDVHW